MQATCKNTIVLSTFVSPKLNALWIKFKSHRFIEPEISG